MRDNRMLGVNDNLQREMNEVVSLEKESSRAVPKPAGVHGRCWVLIRLFTVHEPNGGCCSSPNPSSFTASFPVCL